MRQLSPWSVRLLVYLVLTAIALLAIRTIDGHVMARDTGIHQTQAQDD